MDSFNNISIDSSVCSQIAIDAVRNSLNLENITVSDFRSAVREAVTRAINMQLPLGKCVAPDCEILETVCREVEQDVWHSISRRMNRLIFHRSGISIPAERDIANN